MFHRPDVPLERPGGVFLDATERSSSTATMDSLVARTTQLAAELSALQARVTALQAELASADRERGALETALRVAEQQRTDKLRHAERLIDELATLRADRAAM